MKDIFDVNSLDVKAVATMFGMANPIYVDLGILFFLIFIFSSLSVSQSKNKYLY